MSKTRLFSSDEVSRAPIRAGFELRRSRGSHRAYVRKNADGTHRTAIVIANKQEIPRGTLRSILQQAGLTEVQFLELAAGRAKGRRRKAATS